MSGEPSRRRPTRFLVAAIAYAAIIFTVSQIPGRELSRIGIDVWDKAIHAAEYLPLGALIMGWLTARRGAPARWREVGIAAGVALAYGALDELHQSFVPGRQPSLLDVAADALGGTVGAVAMLVLSRRSAGRGPEPLHDLEAREEEQPVELLAGDPGELDDRRDRE
jgi:VanZ family protein